MTQQSASVSDLFRRAQVIRGERPTATYKEIKDLMVKEFTGQPFPHFIT